MGGLGNQMFQYAAGLCLARRKGAGLCLDLSAFRADPKRSFMLDQFGIKNIKTITSFRFACWQRYRVRFSEPHFQYCEAFESLTGDAYLDGYWQSPRYFAHLRGELQRVFTPVNTLSESMQAMLNAIENKESVGIHVRRGDYVQDPIIHAFHGVCGLDYYRMAMQEIQSRVPKAHFFVFTDDPDWVVAELDLGARFELVTGKIEANVAQEWWLLSRCKHHIVANSTFSWWAAWICGHSTKVVIAPLRWFADESVDTTDLVPTEWLRL